MFANWYKQCLLPTLRERWLMLLEVFFVELMAVVGSLVVIMFLCFYGFVFTTEMKWQGFSLMFYFCTVYNAFIAFVNVLLVHV